MTRNTALASSIRSLFLKVTHLFSQTSQHTTHHPSSAQRLLVLWLMLICLLPASAIAVPTMWQWGHPNPHGSQNNAVIWGDSEFVAVGEGGTIVTSKFGLVDSWTRQPSTTSQPLNDIAWNGTRYVSVGDLGTIISRKSDEEWSIRTSGTTHKLTNVIWNDEKFVAIGEHIAFIDDPINGSVSRPAATILTSVDGFNWKLEVASLNQDRYSDIPPPRLRGVTWDNNRFVASSDDGAILTSVDGITWHTRSINSIAWNSASTLYIAVGDNGLALSSPDGTNWTILTTNVTDNLLDIAWGSNKFVAVGTNGAVISTDDNGVTWTTEVTGSTETLRSITFGAAIFITVGNNGTILYRFNAAPTWTVPTSGVTEHLHSIAFADDGPPDKFVAVGNNGTVINSANLTTWTKASDLPTDFSTDLLNVSWGNNRFITTGKDGILLTAANDGDVWTERTSGISGEWLFDSAWDGTNYIAVGSNGTLITSPDTVTWDTKNAQTNDHLLSIISDGTSTLIGGEYATQITTTDPNNIVPGDLIMNGMTSGRITPEALNDILFANSQFTAVGNAGTILTSNDALYWTTPGTITGPGITNDLLKLSTTHVSNNLIASGAWGTLLLSSNNGADWSSIGPPIAGNADFLNDITSGLTSTLVTVGSGGAIFTSGNNGVKWSATAGPTKTRQDINGLTAGDSLLVAVGDNGVILNSTNGGVDWARQTSTPEYLTTPPTTACTSSHLHDVAWKPVAPTRFVAVGDAGAVCISSDGSDWTTLSPTVAPDGSSSLYGIAWGKDQFIAVGGSLVNSVIYTSPKGDVWTLRNSSEPHILRDIAWNNDHFIAVGDGGTITTSPKGIAWTRNSSGTTIDLSTIAIGDDMMVTTGTTAAPLSTTVLRNLEGTWEGGEGQNLANVRINDLSFGGTQFAGIGPSGTIIVSEDAQRWTEISTGTNSLFKAVTWDESKFIAAGAAGHILYATNPDLVITGGFVTEKVRDGEVARYKFTITNRGITTATNVQYEEALPRTSTFLSATSTRGHCTLATSLTCLLGDMATGETDTITIDVTATSAGTLQHTASARSDFVDSDEANNTIVISIDATRGNSDSGGAVFSYWSLTGLLILLLITRFKSESRNRDSRKLT